MHLIMQSCKMMLYTHANLYGNDDSVSLIAFGFINRICPLSVLADSGHLRLFTDLSVSLYDVFRRC